MSIEGEKILGWAVWTDNIDDAALYTVNQREQALHALRTWKNQGARMVALVQHPDTPNIEK